LGLIHLAADGLRLIFIAAELETIDMIENLHLEIGGTGSSLDRRRRNHHI
jgi:hypothetical protein